MCIIADTMNTYSWLNWFCDCKSFSLNAIEVRNVLYLTSEMVPKFVNVERPTSNQLYVSVYERFLSLH